MNRKDILIIEEAERQIEEAMKKLPSPKDHQLIEQALKQVEAAEAAHKRLAVPRRNIQLIEKALQQAEEVDRQLQRYIQHLRNLIN